MTNAEPLHNDEMDIPRKCYDNLAYDNFKTPGDFPVSTNPTNRNVSFSKTKEKTDTGSTFVQYRYIVTLFGFFMYCELDCFRIATSMSVVKMVNSTAVEFYDDINFTIDSCPLNDSQFAAELYETAADGEFNWSPQIQGYILSAGFLGYVISQVPAGIIAEAYGAKNIFLSGVLIASLAHMFCPFAARCSSYLMIAMQFIRGMGQGLHSPANSVITAKWFPRQERGFLNSLIFSGCAVGSSLAYVTSGALCSSTLFGGWPSVYFIFGGLGLVFSLCVYLFLYESPRDHPRIGKAELRYILENQECDLSLQKRPPTPWRKIFTSVPVHMMFLSVYSHFWTNTHQLSEHPIFLGNILHFPIQTNGILNAIPFAFQILLIFLGGWISKWLNTHNYVGVDMVRKGCTMLFCLGYSLGLLGMYYAECDRLWSNVCSIIAFSFVGLSFPGCVIVPNDMSPTFAGSLFAISNTFASSASFVFPLVVGIMMDAEESLEQWNKIFLLCIAVTMSSGILFCLFGSAEVQPWNFPPTEENNSNLTKDEGVGNGCKENTLSREFSIHL